MRSHSGKWFESGQVGLHRDAGIVSRVRELEAQAAVAAALFELMLGVLHAQQRSPRTHLFGTPGHIGWGDYTGIIPYYCDHKIGKEHPHRGRSEQVAAAALPLGQQVHGEAGSGPRVEKTARFIKRK